MGKSPLRVRRRVRLGRPKTYAAVSRFFREVFPIFAVAPFCALAMLLGPHVASISNLSLSLELRF